MSTARRFLPAHPSYQRLQLSSRLRRQPLLLKFALAEKGLSSLSLREIANSLYVSHNTAKTHTRSLYRKLQVTTREDAIERAREEHLI